MLTAGQSIGPRFFLVSFVPSFVALTLGWTIILSGAFEQRPTWDQLWTGARAAGLEDVAALSLLSVVLALVTHPFQTDIIKGLRAIDSFKSFQDS